MTVDHYENFPVASVLLPRRMRTAVEHIYWFARGADDIADEGEHPPAWRMAALGGYRAALDRIAAGVPSAEPPFSGLADSISRHRIPLEPFYALLSAFEQDVIKLRYATYDELSDYCSRSANPVGRLLLHLHGDSSPSSVRQSDAICTALQLINFWQDLALDWAKGRVYLPQEDLVRFGVAESDIAEQNCDARFQRMMAFQICRSRDLMLQGAPLARRIGGRFGIELRLIVQGGLRILERIEAAGFDVFRQRPTLGPADWARMLIRSFTRSYRAGGETVLESDP